MLAKKSSALGAAFLIGLTAASVATAQAQNPAPAPPDSQRVERQRVERREARRDQERRVAGRDDRVHKAGKSRMRMLFRGVGVTDAQKAQLREIHERFRPRYQELRKTLRASREASAAPDTATRRQIEALAQEERAELRAVLTPEQREVFDANAAAMRERAAARRERVLERRSQKQPQ